MNLDQADQLVVFEKLYPHPQCLRDIRPDLPWNRSPQRVPRSTISGLQVLAEEMTQAAQRFDPLRVMYIQADRDDIPWSQYVPETENGEFRLSGEGPQRIVSSMYAVDSPVWLQFFSSPEASASICAYSDLCFQALRWERLAFPRTDPRPGGQNAVLIWTLGLFDLAWNHPSVTAQPMFRNGTATFPATAVEHSVRHKLQRFEHFFFRDVPVPLPGFFRILGPDCFRASAWRIRRVLDCCLEESIAQVSSPNSARPTDLISQRDAAKEIGVWPSTIARWIKKKLLPAWGARGARRVSKAYLLAHHEQIHQRRRVGLSKKALGSR